MNTRFALASLALTFAAGCAAPGADATPRAATAEPVGTVVVVQDTTIDGNLDAAGTAEPIKRATLSTRLMGTVTEVLVHEGDRVARGQVLVRINASDLDAKQRQAAAGLTDAEAVHANASIQLARMRALYADSAAPKAMLDAAETGFARADAAVKMARGATAELDAVRDYATIRAPFDGTITKRFVDTGALAAPGAPLITIEDDRRLRISASIPADVARLAGKVRSLEAVIEGVTVSATLEGIVPGASGAVYIINAIASNPTRSLMSGGAATLRVPVGRRQAILLPAAAVAREGDLATVRVQSAGGILLRFVKTSPAPNGMVEVLSGLSAGERVFVTRVGAM